MGLARKGTRLLTVEDGRYRWIVAPEDEPGLGIVVEAADAAGQRMVTWVEHDTIISPWLVREAILHALSHGWRPRERGPELVFRLPPPYVRKLHQQRLTSLLLQLCDAVEERVHGVEAVRELVGFGEDRIAFEDLCTHLVDAERDPKLTAAELERFATLGEGLGCRSEWVDLVERLEPGERGRIPAHLRTLAVNDVTDQLAAGPANREWLERLRELLNP
jgi:hypothetical protein